MERKSPEFIFSPKTVALVGASPQKNKISGVILESILKAGFNGKVFPVNPKYEAVSGLKCYPSIDDIKEVIDLVVFSIPAAAIPPIIRNSSDKIRGAVIISGGFAETGENGRALEKELRDIVRHTGVRIIGPNCMGIYDTVSKLDTFFIPHDRIKRPGEGALAIISQSGSFAVTAMDELAAEGIGVSRVISYGNRADLNESDCLEFLSEDERTDAVALYIESVEDGKRFVDAARRCAEKKPVMAIKVGKTEAAVLAARSHTGAMAGRYDFYRAAFKKAGVIELDGYEGFISGCKAFGSRGRVKGPAGRRVMIITDGGGIGVGIADACAEAGLDVAPLKDAVRDELARSLPPYCSLSNPMDLTGSATDELFAEALEKTLSGDDYDMAIVAALWGPPALTDEMVSLMAEKAGIAGKPVIICSPGGEFTRSKMGLFRKSGFPVFTTPESAVRAASILSSVKRGKPAVKG